MTKIRLLLFGAVVAALLALPGAAMAKSHDRNHDGIPDKWEKHFGLSTKRNVAKADPDRDGLNNLGEFRSRTNPRKADTNGNGVNDANDDTDHDGVDNADEMRDHTNPCNPDTNGDGVRDGNEVSGTVVSFTQDPTDPSKGTLTLRLADGSQMSGATDSSTRIECDGADEHSGSHQKQGADDNSGPGSGNSGSGSADDGQNHDQGDDNGNDANDPGDDNGQNAACSTADLTAGTVVREAEFTGTPDSAVFTKLEIQK
jgi:hypothetical protein